MKALLAAIKPICSPALVVGFMVLSVTGGLLFFHVKNGSIMVLHQWFGWVFVAAGLLHLALNLTPLLAYLKLRRAWLSLAAAVFLAIVFGAIGLRHKGPPHMRDGNGPAQIEQHQ